MPYLTAAWSKTTRTTKRLHSVNVFLTHLQMELLYTNVDGIERISDGLCTYEHVKRLTKDETYLYVPKTDIEHLRETGGVLTTLARTCKLSNDLGYDVNYVTVANILNATRAEVRKSSLWVRTRYIVHEVDGTLTVTRTTFDDVKCGSFVASFTNHVELRDWARARLIKLEHSDLFYETRKTTDFMLNLMRL